MLARAEAVKPVLAANADLGRARCRLADTTFAAMREAGFFRVMQPRRWGGFELPPPLVYEIEMILGEGDMSAAWVLGVGGVVAWLLAQCDPRAGDDVWGGDPDAVLCCALRRAGVATPVAGGFRLSGRWNYASGCDHSGWAVVGAMRAGDAPKPEDHLLLVAPRADFEIVDCWRSPGLQATGSNDLIVRDAFVPAHRAIRMIDLVNCAGPGLGADTAPMYRLPFGQIFGAGVSTAAVGGLRAMLDAFVDNAKLRKRIGATLADDPDAQFACAEAAGAIDMAGMIVRRNFGEMLERAAGGEPIAIADRLKYKYQLSTIATSCRDAASKLLELSGTAGLSAASPFTRLMADISAGRQHVTNQTTLHGRDLGWALLGLPERLDFML
jgi:3-hydroxy-9,10-secoandrosta-1,3,5(10)-triene-9,17-dione monooxygenase